jgi:hypothetical protein
MTSRDDIIGNGTNVSGVFMHNANFTRITGIEFGAIRNIKTGDTFTYGIYMENSNDNFLDPAIGNITNEGHYASGLWLSYSVNNTVENTTLGNITAESVACGIMLGLSNNNTFSSGSISDINAPIWWDFYSDASSHGNSAENITISSYPTTISFTYDNGVGIKSVTTPEPDPAGKRNISKYVNATNVTVNSWLFLNVSYNESDLGGVDEATLKMYRYNGTSVDWELADGSGINGVNQVANYVYANITEFSVFAPLGNVTEAPPNITSFAPPSPVNDTVCTWRTFNVTVNQTVNVSWYLNESFRHTNESVTEANYTLHAEVAGEHNVSAVATNANGTDMQTWVWNVTEAPAPPNITSFAPPSPVNDTVCTWTKFNVTVNQTVNVSWYLNNTPLHTNASVTKANCTLHAEVAGEHNVSAVATNANGTDMQTWVWNVSSLDNDGDGVFNAVEDGAPNGGDGNGDGIPDRDQSNVTSLPTATNRGYMTLVLSNCTQFKNVTALTESPADPDYDYPYGLVSFEIMCENGTVEITYNGTADLAGYTYRKYGPTTRGNPETTGWYDFSTYATIVGNKVTLSFQDDRLGDDTGDDGVIVDQGGLGIPGAVAQVPALTPVGIIALVGLLSAIAAISIRKRR